MNKLVVLLLGEFLAILWQLKVSVGEKKIQACESTKDYVASRQAEKQKGRAIHFYTSMLMFFK